MGTRSVISAPQSKPSCNSRTRFGHVEVKKEFRIISESPEDEIKEYAETAMNELLGWYGYDKVDSRDTQGLNLNHFATCKMSRRSPSETDSSDVENGQKDRSPGKRDVLSRGNLDQNMDSSKCIVCSWCSKIVSYKMFSMRTPAGEKSFCSETCFAQCRRANFKRNKTCDWCRHIRHTVNYVDFQDGDHQLQFCSDKCLNQYKMNIFCKETEAHLQLHPHLQGLGSGGNGNTSVRLITPELWLRDCRSESPSSDRSISPTDNHTFSSKVNIMHSLEKNSVQLKSVPSLGVTKVEKNDGHREKSRKTVFIGKMRRPVRYPEYLERRRSPSPKNEEDSASIKSPIFLPPLLPLSGSGHSHHERFGRSDEKEPRPSTFPLFPSSRTSTGEQQESENLKETPYLQTSPQVKETIKQQMLPPPRSLLPPVTVLVPYPIALAIPIPLPIPIPIPLFTSKEAKEEKSSDQPSNADQENSVPSSTPQKSPPTVVPRPIRKRKRVVEINQDEENVNKCNTVPV